MDALIPALVVAALTGLTWIAYAHAEAYHRLHLWGLIVCVAAGAAVLGYQAGAMRAGNAALAAARDVSVEVHAAIGHAADAAQAPWWALGLVAAALLYLGFLDSLPARGIAKRGP